MSQRAARDPIGTDRHLGRVGLRLELSTLEATGDVVTEDLCHTRASVSCGDRCDKGHEVVSLFRAVRRARAKADDKVKEALKLVTTICNLRRVRATRSR